NWPEVNVRSELDKSKVLFYEDSSQQVASFICYREGFDQVEVMALGTIPQYKQQGLMRKLLNHLQDYSRKASKYVILEVSSGNRNAINLYEANEFFKVGVRRAYYGDGSDALVYSYKADLKV
ncbi:MAG: GNAT family N-acetyltransferase, partial [Pseudobdellovibrio sp.]